MKNMWKLITSAVAAIMLIGLSSANPAAVLVPDFSGTWVSTLAARSGGAREVIVISQDQEGMTVTFTSETGRRSETIRIQFGTSKKQQSPAGAPEVVIESAWKAETLVSINHFKMPSGTRSSRHEWSVDSKAVLTLAVIEEGMPTRTRTYTRKATE